jgi:hypothetical protein
MSVFRKLPKKEIILKYWSKYFQNDDQINIHNLVECCFACGRNTKIERAHILSRFNGGDDNVENIHLLCSGCHTDSEFIWGKAYWNWLYWMNKNEYQEPGERYYNFLKKCGIEYEPDKELFTEIKKIEKQQSRKLTNKEIKDIGNKIKNKVSYLLRGGLK